MKNKYGKAKREALKYKVGGKKGSKKTGKNSNKKKYSHEKKADKNLERVRTTPMSNLGGSNFTFTEENMIEDEDMEYIFRCCFSREQMPNMLLPWHFEMIKNKTASISGDFGGVA